jgi:hypothetical protein
MAKFTGQPAALCAWCDRNTAQIYDELGVNCGLCHECIEALPLTENRADCKFCPDLSTYPPVWTGSGHAICADHRWLLRDRNDLAEERPRGGEVAAGRQQLGE